MKLSSLNFIIFNIIKKKLLKEEKKDFKEVVQKRMLEDSKSIGLAAVVANLASIGIVITIPFLVFSLLSFLDFSQNLSILISSVTIFLLSVILFIISIKFFQKKIEIYKNVSDIKEHATSFTWLEPFETQLKHEQSKMKVMLTK